MLSSNNKIYSIYTRTKNGKNLIHFQNYALNFIYYLLSGSTERNNIGGRTLFYFVFKTKN